MRARIIMFVSCLFLISFTYLVTDGSPQPGRSEIYTIGDGSVSNPYGIGNLTQLDSIRDHMSDHFFLLNDIDASETMSWDMGKGFEPLGFEEDEIQPDFHGIPFTGSIDGRGHMIHHLNIIRGDTLSPGVHRYVGLFSYNMGEIENLKLKGIRVQGHRYTGSICGYNTGNIRNCSVTGNIKGGRITGGITGSNPGLISGSSVNVDLKGGGFTGGVCALCDNIVRDCRVNSSIEGEENTGGICGKFEYGSISSCNVTGSVIGKKRCGGLVGEGGIQGDVTILNCVLRGLDITGEAGTGGIVGRGVSFNVRNCQFSGSVSGTNRVGGAFGEVGDSTLAEIFSGGSVAGSGYQVGGGAGMMDSNTTLWNVSYSGSVTGDQEVGGLAGLCQGDIINGTASADINSVYIGGGLCGNLTGSISNCNSTGEIRGLSVTGGVVGRNTGEITNCSGSTRTEGTEIVGGFAGFTDGLINGSGSRGSIIADSITGGFAGLAGNGSDIIRSYSTGHVDSDYVSGGFAGMNWGNISDCYTCSPMTTNPLFGGFSGINGGRVERCYSSGRTGGRNGTQGGFVYNNSGHVSECYWNRDSCELARGVSEGNSSGIRSLNTSEMSSESTYDEWDLNRTWEIWDGYTYPRLRWQVDRPFQLIPPKTNTTMEDENLSLSVEIDDPDPTDVRKYWEVIRMPDWLNFDKWSQEITGLPGNGEVGRYELELVAEDRWGESDSVRFEIEVLNVNDPPVIEALEKISAIQGDMVEINMNCTDIDPTGDKINWTLSTTATWLGINRTSGVISGVPGNEHVGEYIVNVSADDGKGGSDRTSFELTVKNINDPPTDITVNGERNYTIGMKTTLSCSASDPDMRFGDTLNFTWRSNITGIIGYGKAIEMMLPVGVHEITLTAVDSNGSSREKRLTVTISPRQETTGNIRDEEDIPWGILIALLLLFVVCLIAITLYFIIRGKTDNRVKEEVVEERSQKEDIYNSTPDYDEIIKEDLKSSISSPAIVEKGASSGSLLEDLDLDEE